MILGALCSGKRQGKTRGKVEERDQKGGGGFSGVFPRGLWPMMLETAFLKNWGRDKGAKFGGIFKEKKHMRNKGMVRGGKDFAKSQGPGESGGRVTLPVGGGVKIMFSKESKRAEVLL